MNRKSVITTVIAFVLLIAVIAAGLNAIYTVTYVRASFRTYSSTGAERATALKEELNGFINHSSVFLDLSEVRAIVEADPRFEIVTVAKDYPETIVVEVVERREAFAVKTADNVYYVLDDKGYVLGETDSAEGYILLEGFSLSYAGGRAGGDHFDDVLAIYNAMREQLGEVRANVISISFESLADWTLFRIRTREATERENAEMVLLNPADRAGDMAAAATKRYISMTDAERIFCTITVTAVNGDILVDVRNVS